jgi:predicted RNase H-like HicB family nuclease
MTQPWPHFYRGWHIEEFRQPDGYFYAFAPDYDGAIPWHTTCGKTLEAVKAEIDCTIEEYGE